MLSPFDRMTAIVCAKASQAAYEEDDALRAAMLKTAGLTEIAYVQGRKDARALTVLSSLGTILAFQGTQFDRMEIASIFADLKNEVIRLPDGRGIQKGSYEQLEAVCPMLLSPNVPSLVVGHSLGGEIANLYCNVSPKPGNPRLVTFGAPKCADKIFWDRATTLPMRFIHEHDPAPSWPILSDELIQPAGAWWLTCGHAEDVDHRPDLGDLLNHWADHDIAGYLAALEALP